MILFNIYVILIFLKLYLKMYKNDGGWYMDFNDIMFEVLY